MDHRSWRILFLFLINFTSHVANLLETSEHVIPQTPWSIFLPCIVFFLFLHFLGFGVFVWELVIQDFELQCSNSFFGCLLNFSSCRCMFGSTMIYVFRVLSN
jgi:hypothetical protein